MYPASPEIVPSNSGVFALKSNASYSCLANVPCSPFVYVTVNCCLKYNFNTNFPSPVIVPVNTFAAFSSNT